MRIDRYLKTSIVGRERHRRRSKLGSNRVNLSGKRTFIGRGSGERLAQQLMGGKPPTVKLAFVLFGLAKRQAVKGKLSGTRTE